MSFSKMKKAPTEEEACFTYSVDSAVVNPPYRSLKRPRKSGLRRTTPLQIQALIDESLEDFPDDNSDEAAKYFAQIARAVITDNVVATLVYHPKCGEKAKDCEGKKYATAVSTRAALTYWYRTIRPNESVTEWRIDSKTGEWLTTSFGLPTRSRLVSEFMTGLEKTKAKAGGVSVSARALSLSDMHNLYDLCFRPNPTPAEMRWVIVRYTAYLLGYTFTFRRSCPDSIREYQYYSRVSYEQFIHLLECLLLPFQGESFEVKMFTMFTRKSECASHFQRVAALLLVDAGGSRWEVKVW
ncbi:hypothetical protein B0H14DRAFT_2564146 [Mycena olivaceomarginata]|nr:hypothetical protein B0H14DRAFT_2564146 [Mycena olivaceomarginata]